MAGIFYTIFAPLAEGVGFADVETLFTVLLLLAGLILHVGSFLRGTILNVVLFASLFMFLYSFSLNYALAVKILFLYLAVMTITLLFNYNQTQYGTGFVW